MIEDITEEKRADARREALIALGDRLRDLHTHADVVAATAESLGRTLAGRPRRLCPGRSRRPDRVAQSRTGPPRATRMPTDAVGLPTASRSTLAASVGRLGRGDVISVADIAATPERVDDPEGYARLGMRAVIKVPVLRRGRLVGILYVLDREPRDWSAGEIAFAREVAERAWGGLTRIEADEQQRILNRELSHRLKNTLAMVQAIASQTLRNVTDIEAAKEALAARLIALGKAHDILLAGVHESAEMEAVMRGALSIHDDRQPGRFRIRGPAGPSRLEGGPVPRADAARAGDQRGQVRRPLGSRWPRHPGLEPRPRAPRGADGPADLVRSGRARWSRRPRTRGSARG